MFLAGLMIVSTNNLARVKRVTFRLIIVALDQFDTS